MVSKQRKNRPNKKYMPEADWDKKFRDLKERYENVGGKKES
jgi:uncharacterized short protein YbdD (DUF466 family)